MAEGKIRVMVFEVEGSPETISHVLNTASALFVGAQQLAPAAPVIAPAISEPAAPPLRAKVQQQSEVSKPARASFRPAAASAPAAPPSPPSSDQPGQPLSLAGVVRVVLQESPLTQEQIAVAAKRYGKTPSYSQLYQVLWSLTKQGDIAKDESTGKYSLAR